VQLWEYIHREFILGSGEQGLSFLSTQLARFLLIIRKSNPPTRSYIHQQSISIQPITTDLYLRLLHEISSEVSDALLRINKPHNRLNKDSELRDAIRLHDAPNIARETLTIMSESIQAILNQQRSSDDRIKLAQDTLEMSLKVIEDYTSWIDLSLILTPTFIPHLFQSLQIPNIKIRLAATDTLICIITKGMPASNRIQLYTSLNLVELLTTLKTQQRATTSSQSNESSSDPDDDPFNERLAKILNGMGVELCKICDDQSIPLEIQSTSLSIINQLLPLLLSFTQDPNLTSTASLYPFTSAILSRYKKDKKLDQQNHLTQEKRSFLSQLLHLIVIKFQYPKDDLFQWEPPVLPGETEDEDMVIYQDRRRQLKIIIEAIAVIDETLYQETIEPLISNVLDHISTSQPINLSWQEVELALVMLYNYGEAVRGSSPASIRSYVIIPPEEIKKHNKNKDHKINYSQYPLSSLGNLLLKASKALITKVPHPSIAIQWFECVTRYHEFFEIFSGAIQDVLPTFLDDRGLHHPNFNMRYRCCYLFYRFILQGKPAIQSQFNLHSWQAIIDQLQDLIVIEANFPSHLAANGSGDETEILIKLVQSSSAFESQLYLFEAIGILLSFFSANPDQQINCLQSILQPLINQMRTELKNRPLDATDLTNVLKIHHSIMAVGSLAKGFPNNPHASSPWLQVFKTATDDIMSVTKRLNDIRVLRDATRASFHKIVATIGMEALPHVPVLINCLLDKLTKPELVEFLSFVGQLVHKYKENFILLLDSLLLPLFSKIINFLDQPLTGTDDVMCQSELRRGYFNICSSIIGAQMHGIFVSPNNQPHLETILKTIIDQLQAKQVLIPDLRYGFGLLKNFSSIWLKSSQPADPAGPSPVPGFELFLYHQVVPLCFTIPCKPEFDWSDAESYLVLTEIIGILKMLMTLRGNECVEFLLGNFLPSMSCPPEKAQKLVKEIQETTDSKPSRKALVEFFGRTTK
ncbi:hypothetical protein PCASD_26515, partial [Puccinia coronata f. sp. avenae]